MFLFSTHQVILARFLMNAKRKRSNPLNSLFQGYLKLKKKYPILKSLLKFWDCWQNGCQWSDECCFSACKSCKYFFMGPALPQ